MYAVIIQKTAIKQGSPFYIAAVFLVFIILLSDGFFTAIEIKLEVSLIYCPILFYTHVLYSLLLYNVLTPVTHHTLNIVSTFVRI